jgi:hypothetical protein
VKAFNNIHYPHLRVLPRPVGAADRTALPIAGNDPDARGSSDLSGVPFC